MQWAPPSPLHLSNLTVQHLQVVFPLATSYDTGVRFFMLRQRLPNLLTSKSPFCITINDIYELFAVTKPCNHFRLYWRQVVLPGSKLHWIKTKPDQNQTGSKLNRIKTKPDQIQTGSEPNRIIIGSKSAHPVWNWIKWNSKPDQNRLRIGSSSLKPDQI